MKKWFRLIRPKQWLKNVFVLVPVFFGGSLFNVESLCSSLVAFLSFCFVASSIYCFNDIVDVEADRRHPVKCHRPVASGDVSVSQAYALMGIMFCLSLMVLFLLPTSRMEVAAIIVFYFLLNICYCMWLKHHAIVDVCTVSFGFVLRLMAGGAASGVLLSKWIVLMTFLITLFMAFGKRRDDVIRRALTGESPRRNTIRYNLTFINQAITITASVTLVCYIMYTVSPEVAARVHSDYLFLTTIFVLLGLLRYIQIAVVDKKSGDPTKIMLRDRFIQLIVLLFTLTFLLIIYC